MTYGEFKELGFPGIMPMENVLAQALFDRKIDVSEVLNAYYHALEAERHKLTSQFEEACVCLNMHLSKNWKGENRKKLEKGMIQAALCHRQSLNNLEKKSSMAVAVGVTVIRESSHPISASEVTMSSNRYDAYNTR